jgi:Na+-transporting NADH:ubiquinone oxidoreductase subunit NqrD
MSAARRADVEEEARKARSPQRRRRLHPAKRVLLGLAGGSLLLVGLALLVLPGPGLLLVLAGLILLGRALPAVARFEEPVRTRAMQAVDSSVATRWRVAGSVLTGLTLIAAGVVWGARLVPRLPFGGWSTGSSLILSGLIVLGLLLWSYRRVHRASDRSE